MYKRYHFFGPTCTYEVAFIEADAKYLKQRQSSYWPETHTHTLIGPLALSGLLLGGRKNYNLKRGFQC